MSLKFRRMALTVRLTLLASIISLGACSKTHSEPSAKTFASPEDAGSALVAAVRAHDHNALLAILGPESKEIITSGDAVQDKNTGDEFAAGYDVMHRWRKMSDGSETLLIGADNFPFAIPLKKNAGGQWFFDTAAGKDEVLNRRIGRNELTIIEVCEAVVDAQAEYFSKPRDGATTKQYASKFVSDPGRQNGLYWKSAEGQLQSPLGPLAASAASEGYSAKSDAPTAFHGYYFRMLKGQSNQTPGGVKDYLVDGKMVGGFAFVAYPAEYGDSGIMTFMINQDGLLLQKDLGKTTTETATAMTKFDPDTTWSAVEQ
jgi:hypothetical protein